MNVNESRQTLADLEGKLVKATSRATELQTERRRIAFAANTGDAKARKELDKLNVESSTADLEISNMRGAIEEARRRLAEAEREAGREVEMAKAGRLGELAPILRRLYGQLDLDFIAAAKTAEEIRNVYDELLTLGLQHPNLQNLVSNAETIVSSHLMFLPSGRTRADGQPLPGPLKLRHLAPAQRMTAQRLGDGHADQLLHLAAQLLGDEASEAA